MSQTLATLLLLAIVAARSQGSQAATLSTDAARARLANWTFVGYEGGSVPIPQYSEVANVMDYGAKGDGMMDDSAAIQAAIQAAKAAGGGAVIFPPGQYVVTSRLLVDADNIVLRGSGIGTSTLFFPKPLAQVDAVPPPELPPNEDNVISPYSWHEGFITIGTGDMSTQPGFVLLATVMNDAPRGATQLQVDSPGNVTVGDYVMVTMSSPPGSSAVSASLYSNMTTAAEIAGLQGLQYAWRFPSRVVAVGDTYIELERQLPVDIYAAWTAQIRAFVPTVQQSGIEDLTINFAWTHSNPHLHEAGYNAIFLFGCANCWVSSVEIVNCDLGVVTYAANLVTVTDVLIRVSQSRISRVNLYQGHIALGTGIFTTDVLFTNFNVSGSWIHDLTAYGASHVAFLNGTGTNLNMDGHRGAPFATLFHNVYVGLGSRAMTSGGLAAEGFPFASETTFWNIRAKGGKDLTLKTNTLYGYCTFGTYMNFVQDENLATVWKGTPCKDYFMEQGTSARSLSAWLPQLMPRSP